MFQNMLLTPLLPDSLDDVAGGAARDLVSRALAVDPALAGRVRCEADGIIVLTGTDGSAAPLSSKERQRWELHVRLRLATELGEATAAAARVRWDGTPANYAAP